MSEDFTFLELRQMLTDEERYNLIQLLRLNGSVTTSRVYFKHLPD